MAQSIACDVFDIEELLRKILWGTVFDQGVDVMIAQLCTYKRVHRTWLAQCTLLLQLCLEASLRANTSMERRIVRFLDLNKQQCTGLQMLKAFEKVRERGFWTRACCDQSGDIFSSLPNGETAERLEKILRVRKPRCMREMWMQCNQICYCCGKTCSTDNEYAVLLHPYEGQVQVSTLRGHPVFDTDGRPCYQLASTTLPHTNPDEFVTISFQRDDTDGHYFLTVCTGPVMSLAEKHMSNFVRVAQREPWYQENIARIYALRPPQLQSSLNKSSNNYFMANIPLQPLIVDFLPDASVAQIFGRTREEMRKLIAIGGRLRKEQRLMSPTY